MPTVAKAPKQIEVTFDMERETPNTVRFQERGEKLAWKVGRIYVKKVDLAKMGSPKVLVVTIAASK